MENYDLKNYNSFGEFLSEITEEAKKALINKKVKSSLFGDGVIQDVVRFTTTEDTFDEDTEIKAISITANIKFDNGKVGNFHLSQLEKVPVVYDELMNAFQVVAKQRAKECRAATAKAEEERKAKLAEEKALEKAKTSSLPKKKAKTKKKVVEDEFE